MPVYEHRYQLNKIHLRLHVFDIDNIINNFIKQSTGHFIDYFHNEKYEDIIDILFVAL